VLNTDKHNCTCFLSYLTAGDMMHCNPVSMKDRKGKFYLVGEDGILHTQIDSQIESIEVQELSVRRK
jgi:hypothetical protein